MSALLCLVGNIPGERKCCSGLDPGQQPAQASSPHTAHVPWVYENPCAPLYVCLRVRVCGCGLGCDMDRDGCAWGHMQLTSCGRGRERVCL